jgi:hypothetical protein
MHSACHFFTQASNRSSAMKIKTKVRAGGRCDGGGGGGVPADGSI